MNIFNHAFPAEPKRCIFSATTAFMASLAEAMTLTKSFFGVLRESMYAFLTSVLTLNFLTPRLMHSCHESRSSYKVSRINSQEHVASIIQFSNLHCQSQIKVIFMNKRFNIKDNFQILGLNKQHN